MRHLAFGVELLHSGILCPCGYNYQRRQELKVETVLQWSVFRVWLVDFSVLTIPVVRRIISWELRHFSISTI
jgi:hypothetical protein